MQCCTEPIGIQATSDRRPPPAGFSSMYCDQRLKSVADEQRIAVQKAGIARPRHAHSEIVVFHIELVGVVADQDDLEESFGHHVRAAIGRMVVDADDFKADAVRVLVNRGNTIAQQVPGVVAGDDDGKIQRSFHRFFCLFSAFLGVISTIREFRCCVCHGHCRASVMVIVKRDGDRRSFRYHASGNPTTVCLVQPNSLPPSSRRRSLGRRYGCRLEFCSLRPVLRCRRIRDAVLYQNPYRVL